jgi:molybdate transport system regulatory protein
MQNSDIDVTMALRSKAFGMVGRDRIAMLEAAARHGSITKAAQALGLSYKAVWDGIAAINNLLPRPALLTQTGGKGGGGAVLTEDGARLIRSFRRIEAKLAQLSKALLTETGAVDPDLPFWGIAMKTSARNAFLCKVAAIRQGRVNVEVSLLLSDNHRMTATITKDSADALGLAEGSAVVALIKAPFVILAAADQGQAISAGNRFTGTVVKRVDSDVNSEISLDIGDGKTLTAVVTRDSADHMALTPGSRVCALFNASDVILAVG